MKRRVFAVVCGLLLGVMCFAQVSMSVGKPITYLEGDMEQKAYSKVKDQNSHLCALIKVSLSRPLPNPLILEVGGLGVTKTEEQDNGEIWFFVPYQVKNLEFKCKGYTPIPKIPVNLKEGGVYSITLNVAASADMVINADITSDYLKIRLNPADAFISLGKSKEYELGYMDVNESGLFSQNLDFGTWYYKVEQDLYKTYEGVVEFDENTSILEVTLEPDYAYLSISTEPNEAKVYVDNKFVGNSPVNIEQKLKSGKYAVKLIKEDYYSESIDINLNGDGNRQNFKYILRPRFGEVECVCEDAQAELWVDDKYKGIGRWKGNVGSSGSHILEARKSGHKSQSINFSSEEGKSIVAAVGAPVPLYAILKVETSPAECEVYVDGQKIGESPLQVKLLACEHQIKLVKGDFKPQEEQITLSHNEQLLYRHTFTEKKNQELPAANCFIVSKSGYYAFNPVKGNSTQSVGQVASVEVLWETFGTEVKPNVGDLIPEVAYKNGQIVFSTSDPFREGNALIAAKDALGTILWSWHIWLTDEPDEQFYYWNAGVMMDRNLGATSATPGDIGALGLLYQWGRKDPFLGVGSIKSGVEAASSKPFSKPVKTNSKRGTIAYAIEHPTTFICSNDKVNYNWYTANYNGLWKSQKTIYDPCPAGWRVPDGGENGVWAKSSGSSDKFTVSYDKNNKGINFYSKFGSNPVIWYPSVFQRWEYSGELGWFSGTYWAVFPKGSHSLGFNSDGDVWPVNGIGQHATGQAIRCQKELCPFDVNPIQINKSIQLPSSNSFIVSKSGTYSFMPVKGNSTESVGNVASVEVLWESFGSSRKPSEGDLIQQVLYKGGKIFFSTIKPFIEGNALIAAKDARGTILWSWHIWMTDEPEEQEYYNNAGIMMDRNLGATSATPGDVGAYGLLYQWGRKDPFLGIGSIKSYGEAASTKAFPAPVVSNYTTGTIAYATEHPTTFIYCYDSEYDNKDWQRANDNVRWQSQKTIYDPCPAGWRVPDGGEDGVWAKAIGSSSKRWISYDETNKGINFSSVFGSSPVIWYPAVGFRVGVDSVYDYDYGGQLNGSSYGQYWSTSVSVYFADGLSIIEDKVDPDQPYGRAEGNAVRCIKE